MVQQLPDRDGRQGKLIAFDRQFGKTHNEIECVRCERPEPGQTKEEYIEAYNAHSLESRKIIDVSFVEHMRTTEGEPSVEERLLEAIYKGSVTEKTTRAYGIISNDICEGYSFQNFAPITIAEYLEHGPDLEYNKWGCPNKYWVREADIDQNTLSYEIPSKWGIIETIVEEMSRQYPEISFAYKYCTYDSYCDIAGYGTLKAGEWLSFRQIVSEYDAENKEDAWLGSMENVEHDEYLKFLTDHGMVDQE